MSIPQPYSLPDIRKYTKEVFISLLIAYSIYKTVQVDSNQDKYEKKIDKLHYSTDSAMKATIVYYRAEIAKERQNADLRAELRADSTLKAKVGKEVEKALKQ